MFLCDFFFLKSKREQARETEKQNSILCLLRFSLSSSVSLVNNHFPSSSSFFSHSVLQEREGHDMSIKKDEAIRLQNEISYLKTENKMFQAYLQKHVEKYELSQCEKALKHRPRMSQMKQQQSSVPRELTLDQKLKISSKIMNDTKEEINASKARDEKLLQTLMAVLEETDIRISELRKEAYVKMCLNA